MIALDEGNGIEWNGQVYADEDELGRAVNAVAGDRDEPPVITITPAASNEFDIKRPHY